MYLEQQLRTCEVCCRLVALEYSWPGLRVPRPGSERVTVRWFECPACHHCNPFLTLLYAGAFRLKLIPGPEPAVVRVHPNRVRQIWASRPSQQRAGAPLSSLRAKWIAAATRLYRRFRRATHRQR